MLYKYKYKYEIYFYMNIHRRLFTKVEGIRNGKLRKQNLIENFFWKARILFRDMLANPNYLKNNCHH